MSPINEQSLSVLKARAEADELSDEELSALEIDARAGARKLAKQVYKRWAAEEHERERLIVMTSFERELHEKGCRHVAGVDEVGAGPLAGPVVAGAVVLAPGTLRRGVDDSKKLTASRRAELAAQIREEAVSFSVGACTPKEIDELNIYQASREAMRRAVGGLEVSPDHLLVDARTVPRVAVAQTPLKKGDQRSQSIAAASILAKVYRDELMEAYSKQYPGYGFEVHAGYPTPAHLKALAQLGPTPIHRQSFGPVQRCVSESDERRG